MLTLDKIYHAAFVLKDVIRKTGVIHAPKLNPESNIYLTGNRFFQGKRCLLQNFTAY